MRSALRRSDKVGVVVCTLLTTGLLCAGQASAQSLDWTVASDTAADRFGQPNADITTRRVVHGDETWTVRTFSMLDSPLALSRPDTRAPTTHVAWRRDWTALHETSPSGLELSVSPHAGVDWDEHGSAAVAGATVRVGHGLDRLAPDGANAFGEKARWYLFASGSKRALGYNFTRQRDGRLANAGLSHDQGQSALGDAAIGIAWRKGPIQSSIGLAYREVEISGLRGYSGLRTDVDEGVLAFQFSFRPQ